MSISRRTFLAYSGGTALTLFGFDKNGIPRALAKAIPGGTTPPTQIPKYVAPLVIPPQMPPTAPGSNTYDIAVRQFTQPILPAPFAPTTVWSYGPSSSGASNQFFNYPAFTIETKRNTPITVTWRNQLAPLGPHLFAVDPYLHWANPNGVRDTRPTPDPNNVLPAYTGPVPIITHVHGHEHVEDWSDGYPEAWYMPVGATTTWTTGTWYNKFKTKASDNGILWDEGSATFKYPNSQRPTTLWYHDHSLGITRLNVYAGPAGFFIIRSDNPLDEPVDLLAPVPGTPATLPGGLLDYYAGLTPTPYEIPIVIQDRSFGTLAGGPSALFYPDTRAFFDGYPGPYIPTSNSDVPPIWNPEFFGNVMVVNGVSWPFQTVEPRRYRLRFLNGCNSRFLILQFSDPKVDMWQIGNEGGYLAAPVNVKQLLIAPAERADVIVDFSRVKFGKSVELLNKGPDAPFGGGGFRVADPQSTGTVMRFDVTSLLAGGGDPTTPPAQLGLPLIPAVVGAAANGERNLSLNEIMSANAAIPVEANLGTYNSITGPTPLRWGANLSENPEIGNIEDWVLHNFTADAHPIHVHEVLFRVLGRRLLDPKTGLPAGALLPPEPTENGWKDTVIAYPGQATYLRIDFTNAQNGQYVWHCHILEHEDNEMMRPYAIGPLQQPIVV